MLNKILKNIRKNFLITALSCFTPLNPTTDDILKYDYFLQPETAVSDTTAVETNNIKNIDGKNIEDVVNYFVEKDSFKFKDNSFYQNRRIDEAKKILENIISPEQMENVAVVNKTFQKFMLFKYAPVLYFDEIVVTDSNEKMKLPTLNTKYEWQLVNEYDCSTAKVYGKKQRMGDGKTPEDWLRVNSIELSENKLFEGLKMYGPYCIRFDKYPGILAHGNGTDTIAVKNWIRDSRYKEPESLGVFRNNFGYGLSHGCIRLDNLVIRELIESEKISLGMKFVVFEDNKATALLENNYNKKLLACKEVRKVYENGEKYTKIKTKSLLRVQPYQKI